MTEVGCLDHLGVLGVLQEVADFMSEVDHKGIFTFDHGDVLSGVVLDNASLVVRKYLADARLVLRNVVLNEKDGQAGGLVLF